MKDSSVRFPRSERSRATIAAFFVLALAAGCSGGASTIQSITVAPPPTASPAPGQPTAQQGTATFLITWPTDYVAAARTRNYLSKSTAYVTIAVNGNAPTKVSNPNITTATPSASQPSPTPQTSVTVPAPVGNDTFSVGDYDTTGDLLAQNAVPFNIVAGASNVVPITLNGNLASVACSPVAPFVSGTAPTFAMVGPAGQIAVIPKDAGGNIIVAPGSVPAVTLSAASASTAIVAPTSTANLYNVNVLAVGAPATLNASGQNLANATVSSACSVTRQLALYVVNHGINNIGAAANGSVGPNNASITIYPVTASGNVAPTAVIAGSNTVQNGLQFDAVDNSGNLFVSNQGPVPGATFGPNSGYVNIYGPAANGNVAPVSSIAGLHNPEGLAFDGKGVLYAVTASSVLEYPPAQNGTTAAAAPTTTIVGSNTDIGGCFGLTVNNDFSIDSACGFNLVTFAPGATGNAMAGITFAAGTTSMSYNSDSWTGIAANPSNGDVSVTAANNNLDFVDTFSMASLPGPGSTATPTPSGISKGIGYGQPFGIFVDSNGQYYVANFGNSSIEIFSSETVFQTGLATATISGAATLLSNPYGVTVR